MHALAPAHDTPLSCTAVAPEGSGMLWADQLVPFQRSATATLWPTAVLRAAPTAVHAVGDVHETPVSWTSEVFVGNGTGWIVHLVPFQPSASGCVGKSEKPDAPTAMHEVAEVQDTPCRCPKGTPAGIGTDRVTQLVPFQVSADGRCSPSELMKKPTPVHAVLDVREAEKSWPLRAWAAGTDCNVQVTAPATGAAINRITTATHAANKVRIIVFWPDACLAKLPLSPIGPIALLPSVIAGVCVLTLSPTQGPVKSFPKTSPTS